MVVILNGNEGKVSERGHEGLLNLCYCPWVHLGAGYTDIFGLSKFIKMYSSDMYTFLYSALKNNFKKPQDYMDLD